ncbi:hypothetical protein [Lysinibacillus capsici]|uniref:hypothetical protein n=1 Tax=Lysinibacillus capsici TaxID=2115968 RepID=UPI002896F242|nr:hypothetical protein [Lysinibacillus capsici]
MIVPDKYTPPEKSLIYKAMKFYSENPEALKTVNRIKYSEKISKDIDEYIKVLTILYTLGILKESED